MPILLRFGRLFSLILLAVVGTSVLMYCSPGYFSDAREMDAAHASSARSDLAALQSEQRSLSSLLASQFHAWAQGDLGQSRQYGVPVSLLVRERAGRSVRILATGVLTGWMIAALAAIPVSVVQRTATETLVAIVTALLLALPVGVLATVCVVANTGGPILVLALVVAVRDFKLIYRMLQTVWRAPYVLHAYASGLSRRQVLRHHLAPVLGRELISLAMMSFALALSLLVPVEVVFDVAGIGQLAWSAAMNRDLPVLAAVTALMATCIGLSSFFMGSEEAMGASQCA
jgi:peptide/nickel transport system permease protein